ncbi:MAG TPA: hypothetical protein VF501_01435, partial [Thiobacillus sp.]
MRAVEGGVPGNEFHLVRAFQRLLHVVAEAAHDRVLALHHARQVDVHRARAHPIIRATAGK